MTQNALEALTAGQRAAGIWLVLVQTVVDCIVVDWTETVSLHRPNTNTTSIVPGLHLAHSCSLNLMLARVRKPPYILFATYIPV